MARKIQAASGGSHKKYNTHNYIDGYYNDYNYRPGSFGEIRSHLCTNYLEYEGIVFGQFYCPIEGFEALAEYCCAGPSTAKEQFCCTVAEYNAEKGIGGGSGIHDVLLEEKRRTIKENIMFTMIIVVPVIAFILLIVGFAILCCVKRKIYEKIPIFSHTQRENTKSNCDEEEEEEDEEQIDEEDEEEQEAERFKENIDKNKSKKKNSKSKE